ncbi:MAG: aryl-sulfate sulfotransferase [Myxococcales bacterium]|nr:aryl-sulfate sulfotransferase [Myxococcales bacterium]
MVAWMWTSWVACTGPRADVIEPPTFEENTDGAWLTTWLRLTTSEPTALQIAIDDGERVREQAVAPATEHRVLLAGLLPDTDHTVTVTISDVEGRSKALEPVTLRAGALPADLPPLQLVVSEPDQMEPGLTLIDIGPYLTAVDEQGRVRWALRNELIVHELTATDRGTVVFQSARVNLTEVSLSGAVVNHWVAGGEPPQLASAIRVPLEAMHHDAVELPDGNWLTLSVERRQMEAYPTSERDRDAPTQRAWVAGDVVAEFRPDGTVVKQFSLLDRLDPDRIGYDAVNGDHWDFWWSGPTRDWSHGNAIFYDAARNEDVVSLRHQDAVVALDHDSGELKWIFAPEANWGPEFADLLLRPASPDLLVPYHQHSAKITEAGYLMLFDNGNHRASAFEDRIPNKRNGSRGAEFRLDHAEGTWDLVRDYGPQLEPLVFSGSLSDADDLPQTGNMLVTFGNVANPGYPGVIVREVTAADPPQIVFELTLPEPLNLFRAQRVSGLIPGF